MGKNNKGTIFLGSLAGIALLLCYWGYQSEHNGKATNLAAFMIIAMPFLALIFSIISIIENKTNLLNILTMLLATIAVGYVVFFLLLGAIYNTVLI